MTSPRRFEQDLPVLLEALYVTGTPDYRDDLVRLIAATRQRPAWTFLERWLPMDTTTARVAAPRLPWRALGVLALIALLLAAALAVLVGTQRRLPAPYGFAENGQLAYVVDGDVYLQPDLDSPAVPFITGPTIETYALFSLLGDRLAFLREVDDGEDLWVIEPDGSDMTRLGGPYRAIDWLEWSPDGRYLSVSYDRSGINALDVVPVDGSGGRRIAADMPAMSPTWRPPDGSHLLFRGQEQGRWGFYLVDAAEGGEPVRLQIDGDGLISGGYDLQGPAWSPTGDRLAFHSLVALPQSQMQTPGFRIFMADIAPDGAVTKVEALPSAPWYDDELNPVFTPDGLSLVYQQRMGLTVDPPGPATVDRLFIRPADGSGQAIDLGIRSSPGEGFSWAIAPDGTSILIHLFAEGEDWLVDPATATATKTDLGSNSGVTWQRKAFTGP